MEQNAGQAKTLRQKEFLKCSIDKTLKETQVDTLYSTACNISS